MKHTTPGSHHQLLGAAVAALLLITAAPAIAQDPLCPDGGRPNFDRSGTFIGCVGGGTGGGDESGTPVGGGGGAWTPPPGYVLVEWPSPGYEEDGTPCIVRDSRWIPEEDRPGYLDSYHRAFFLWTERMDAAELANLSDCSGQPDGPALDPEMIAEMIEGELPLPAPAIDPGRAIAGLRSYLSIGAPTTFDRGFSGAELPFEISVVGEARYRVDWGDGTVETFGSAGGPYPDGDVTHVYTEAGDVTVTVTPSWSIEWTGAGQDFAFDVELAPSTVDLPVGQVQSVRTD